MSFQHRPEPPAEPDPRDSGSGAGRPAEPPVDAEAREAAEAAEATGEGHISFVQRLEERYGKSVDPGITLASEDDESSDASSSSRDLLRKLATNLPESRRYQIVKEIARGGMGTILRVWDDDLRRNLAMKVMIGRGRRPEDTPASDVDEEQLGRFLEEAQITGQLDHPGVVPVHDLGLDAAGRCYFTMRLVRGRELKEILELTREGKEDWTITKTLNVILKVCEAMAFAHSKGVVHRDLKPANVMVGRFGEVYVMDWGLARVLGRRDTHDLRLRPHPKDASAMSLVRTVRRDDAQQNPDSPLVTMDGDVVGTPSYMAVEQAQGKLDEVGPRSDVYSLGTILYTMLTGRAPYVEPGERVSPHTVLNRVLQGPPEPVSKLATSSPDELVAICEKAMARRPEDRYASMLAVADDIQAFLENRVVGAYEGGSIAEARKWIARNRGIAASLAAFLIFAIVTAFGFAYQKDRRVKALANEQAETLAARKQAERNLEIAERNERQAKQNYEDALALKARADENARAALEAEGLARRSSYSANISAADFSLLLRDVVEARRRLAESDESLRGWEWHHLSLRANEPLRSLGSEATQIDSVAFSPDARRVISLSRQGRLRIRDAETGEIQPPDDVLELSANASLGAFAPLVLDVSRNGRLAALAGRGSTVRLFELATSRRVYPPEGGDGADVVRHEARTSTAAFSPDGARIASGADDGSVIVWDPIESTILAHLSGPSGAVTDLAWSPDGRELAGASLDGTVRVWDVASGEMRHNFRGHFGAIHGVVWGGSGDRLYSVSADGLVNEWSVAAGRLVRSLSGHEGPVRSVDIDPSGRRLVTASGDETVRVWDLATGASEILLGHGADVLDARFSLDGKEIVSSSSNGDILVWDARGHLSRTLLAYHQSDVNAVAFHPDGRTAATGGSDGLVVIWDTHSARPRRVLTGHAGLVLTVAFSADGRKLVTASQDKTARLWDIETGTPEVVFRGHSRWVSTVAITPDGTRVITGSGDRTIRVWDAATGDHLRTLTGHHFPIEHLAFDGEGRRLVSSSSRVFVWSLDTDEPLAEYEWPRHKALAAAFDPLGERIFVVGQDSYARIWDLAQGRVDVEVKDHAAQVYALAVCPDGSRFVTASADGTLRVRDARTGESLLVLSGHEAEVTSVAFSADGTRLLSGSRDQTALVWETGLVHERRDATLAAIELDERARPVVEDYFARYMKLEDVLVELQRADGLDEEVRRVALRLARLQGDDPMLLDRITRGEVAFADLPPETYSRALRRAEVATDLDGANPRLLCTLGMAQFRNGEARAAIGTLRSAATLAQRRLGSGSPAPLLDERDEVARLLFLAMCHERIDDATGADETLEEARRRLAEAPDLDSDRVLLSLLEEAEGLVGRRATGG